MNKTIPYFGYGVLYLLHLLLHKWHEMQKEFFPEWDVYLFQFPEAGYFLIFTGTKSSIWISNESNLDVNVYFDDLKITHISKLTIVQADDYYPSLLLTLTKDQGKPRRTTNTTARNCRPVWI